MLKQKTIKVKFGDITKRIQLVEGFIDQVNIIKDNFNLDQYTLDQHFFTYRTEVESKLIIIDKQEFDTILKMIKSNQIAGTVKFELIKKSNLDESYYNNKGLNISKDLDLSNFDNFNNNFNDPKDLKDIKEKIQEENILEQQEKEKVLNYEEIKIQELLAREMELIQKSILSSITNTISQSKIYANQSLIQQNNYYAIPAQKAESFFIEPLKVICKLCNKENLRDFIFYCSKCVKAICFDCFNHSDIPGHILLKSYEVLKINDCDGKYDKLSIEEFNFKCISKQGPHVIKSGKSFTLVVVLVNIGNKPWNKNFVLSCTESSTIKGENFRLPQRFAPKSEITFELKLMTQNLSPGNYTSTWIMQTDKLEPFGTSVTFDVIIIK